MKKAVFLFVAVAFSALLILPMVSAALTATITVANPTINQNANQSITATTNQKGTGVIFVVQPAPSGYSWINYLNAHHDLRDLWYNLPSDVRAQMTGETGGFIVSFVIVNMQHGGGGTHIYSFPTDFTGLNGQPSTAIPGTYKVVFAFLANDHSCFHHQISFDCGQWFVVPESTLGTAMAIMAPIAAVATITLNKKRKERI